jgi:putative heme iron utilization protein
MLDQLRDEALALITDMPHCTLSTLGPAGIQASMVTCVVRDACVYILVPHTADHLFNLEYELEVVLTTARWQLRGAALALGGVAGPRGTAPRDLIAHANRAEAALLEIFPVRIHLEAVGQRQHRETIDFAEVDHAGLPMASRTAA